MSKPYMPLMMGDWIRGTRGMRADVKGVYIGLLIHQYDHGFLPADIDTISLIEPQVGSVWVMLSDKFPEVEPGKRKNLKLEEVRAFWNKQSNNGKKGGRPNTTNPKVNPNHNPKDNPNHNLHNDLDLDTDYEVVIDNNTKGVLIEKLFNDELYVAGLGNAHRGKDIKQAFEECYIHHSNAPNPPRTIPEWKQKLNTWLSNTKFNKNGSKPNTKQQQFTGTVDYVNQHYSDKINKK